MSTAAALPWLLLLYFFSERKKPRPPQVFHPAFAPAIPPAPMLVPAVFVPPPLHPSMQPAPLPVGMPEGLPAFPGPGWVPDSPPPAPVIARAVALLPQLWRQGQGAHTTEQTAGRWITYLATMIGTKRSVVAYRLANVYGEPGGLSVAPMPPVTSSPTGLVPAVYHPPAAGAPYAAAVPTAAPVAAHSPATSPGLPTLRLAHPNMKGPSVVYLQRKLGIADDGVFGKGTDKAVRAFQQTHGLKVDGVVGRATWAALG